MIAERWLGVVQSLTGLRHKPSDLVWRRKNDVGSVTHHASSDKGGCVRKRAFLTGIGLKAQVSLPEFSFLSVCGRDHIRILAVSDRLNAIFVVELLQVGA